VELEYNPKIGFARLVGHAREGKTLKIDGMIS